MFPVSALLEQYPTRVAAATVAPHRRLTLAYLIRLFQEAAMRNTLRLGISSPELMDRHGLTWVLRRQFIRATRWPLINEAVRVVTVPTRTERGLITYRDFYLLDATGRELVTSTSSWLLMDVNSRRLKPLPDSVLRIAPDFPPTNSHLPWPAGKVAEPARPDSERQFRVGFAQLDFNNHLTNPIFPEYMIEPLGLPFLSSHLPVAADIAYAYEARYGELLTAQTQRDGSLAFTHSLTHEGGTLATMRSHWAAIAPAASAPSR